MGPLLVRTQVYAGRACVFLCFPGPGCCLSSFLTAIEDALRPIGAEANVLGGP